MVSGYRKTYSQSFSCLDCYSCFICKASPFPDWSQAYVSFAYKKSWTEVKIAGRKTCSLLCLVLGPCLICIGHNWWSPRNHQRGNQDGSRPLLSGLICSHGFRVYCLFNKSCLLELSWSVVAILSYKETRTKGEELTQHEQGPNNVI